MEDFNQTHWRKMFERGGNAAPQQPRTTQGGASPFGGYDDGYQPPPQGGGDREQLSHADISDEAAMALAFDSSEYKPWVLQRGRSRPPMMLHLRRFEPKSGKWIGWQVSYPHLVAVEYVGDTMLSLDFGTRQFVIEGIGLTKLAHELQQGIVLTITEFARDLWRQRPLDHHVQRVCLIGPNRS